MPWQRGQLGAVVERSPRGVLQGTDSGPAAAPGWPESPGQTSPSTGRATQPRVRNNGTPTNTLWARGKGHSEGSGVQRAALQQGPQSRVSRHQGSIDQGVLHTRGSVEGWSHRSGLPIL